MILNKIRRAISLFLVFVLSIIVSPNGAASHTVLNEQECKMCITVLSDVHVEGNNFGRYKGFARILMDAKNNDFGNDVGVFLGDDTMNGQEIESLFFYGLVKTNSFADTYVNAMGNHDVGNGEGSYNLLCKRFLDYNKEFLSIEAEKPYYYRVINGVYFITLAPEELCVHTLNMSDAQYEFLINTLEKAKNDNAIAFVCCHHPISNIEGSGKYSLWDILPEYDNVFFLSGHTHWPIEEGWTFRNYGGIKMINLPRCTEDMGESTEDISQGTGHGVQIEIYEDEIVARIRNYYTGEWVEGFTQHYALTK